MLHRKGKGLLDGVDSMKLHEAASQGLDIIHQYLLKGVRLGIVEHKNKALRGR